MRYKLGDKIKTVVKAGRFSAGTIATITRLFPDNVPYVYRAIREDNTYETLSEKEFVGLCKEKETPSG